MKNKSLIAVCGALALMVTFSLAQAQTAAPDPSTAGYELRDPARGFVYVTPNSSWSISANSYNVTLSHGTYYDAYISLRKGYTTYATPQEAYAKKKEYLKSSLPGAEMIKDGEAMNVGTEPAMSMTYKDPAQQKIMREIVFNHKGGSYELSFTVKQENFEAVKADFGAILKAIQTL